MDIDTAKRYWLNLTWGIVIFLVVGTALSAGAETLEPDRLLPYKSVERGDLNLHVFNPPGHTTNDRVPAIVFFFGGGWNGGTPTQFYPQCAHYASAGLVAISAEYRVKKRDNTTPKECVKDGKSAIRWIRDHADELGIDRDKLVAGGGSAGGHVAAATGTSTTFEEATESKTSSRPNALVLFNPVFNNGPGGYGHARVSAYWREISPMHNIDNKTPPTIVFFGAADSLVSVAQMREYESRMKAHGRRCDLHVYDGQRHGFFNPRPGSGNRSEGKYFHETLEESDAFLRSLGFLELDRP